MMMPYMWHELLAKRKANDIISCLAHFIFSTRLGRTGAKWSIWWSDNCPGQNKNNVVMWFFSDLIRRQVYSRIDFKFMVPGHTYEPTDRHFATIEKYCSKIETVYIPQEWYEHVREAIVAVGSKIDVVEMEQDKFRNYRDHLKKLYVARNKDMDGIPLDFEHATWFNFGRGEKLVDGKLVVLEHPNKVWVTAQEAFYDYSHIRICCLIRVQHVRCEDNSVSISFQQNGSQNCCSSLLDHFVVIQSTLRPT